MKSKLNTDKYLLNGLDILFVALNPPVQSNSNGHYFSGKQSAFYNLLYESGLLLNNIDKLEADEKVFDGSEYNFNHCRYGVVDIVPEKVETDSGKVDIMDEHIKSLIEKIIDYRPRIVCIIHSKIRNKFNKTNDYRKISNIIQYGCCGKLLMDCNTVFFMQYFPNGNNIPKTKKIKIFEEMKVNLKE